MKVNIHLSNSPNLLFKSIEFDSLKSILSLYSVLDLPSDDVYFTFNNQILNNNLSLDYYNIKENDIILLNYRIKGGGFNDFLSFIKKHWLFVIIGFIIALSPIISLRLGLIPITASLLKVIFDQSFEKIGVYLATHFGKYTLYNRFKFIFNIFKFFIFILVVYVSITFPIMILCLIMKGQFILDDPLKMCSPLNAAFITGLVLTTLYVLIYSFYRGFTRILDYFKSLFSDTQYGQSTVVPLTESFKKGYDKAKYAAAYINPITGIYFTYLDKFADFVMVSLQTFIDMGCSKTTQSEFGKELSSNIKSIQSKDESRKIQIPTSSKPQIECCSSDNFERIANLLFNFINNTQNTQLLKNNEMYSPAIITNIALYEYAINDSNQQFINSRIQQLEGQLRDFSLANNQVYVPTNQGSFNAILKILFVHTICNVFTLAQNTSSTIHEMGNVYDVVDIMKAGSATGQTMSFFYFICVVALFFCGLFDVY